ncbi:MAG: peptidylprolyl isomerase [Campylobacterota bacterium]|nr:peptidylprolyl isomerase [Campylobacterota bacterium]
MITWMQRHKKYLIVTIWISTIAFVGAGFVGWGQYSYGDKAGAVAKVGNVEVTMGEMQKAYSRMYAQYNQMFQGNFDEEKAKQFGLQKQALQQLTQQALILNLADSYNLEVSDAELLAELKTQEAFFDNGVFNKEIYKQVLSRNNMSMKEYEDDVKKGLLIQKTLKLLPVEASSNESNVLNTIMTIADKINYKVLTANDITVDTSDAKIKPFWETSSQNYMSEVSYDLNSIKQIRVTGEYEESKISKYYQENRTKFKDSEGKILTIENARDAVIEKLNDKATKDKALRTYIAYKKGKLDPEVAVESTTISNSNNPYTAEVLEKVSKLKLTSPYMKPVLVGESYYILELKKVNPSVAKTYEEAKAEVFPAYLAQTKKTKLLELANSSLNTFSGETTDFITAMDADKVSTLEKEEASEFLEKLFVSKEKRSFIVLNSGKIILYDILEQKLLDNSNSDQGKLVTRLKSTIFNEGLIKNLQNTYQTEIFIQGL